VRSDPQHFVAVAQRFDALPQSHLQGHAVDALRPWLSGQTSIHLDSRRPPLGFDLARYAAGLGSGARFEQGAAASARAPKRSPASTPKVP
jgi:hypothetical protein